MLELIKVWPLIDGLAGCDASGRKVILAPGLAGWMTKEQREQAGNDVQAMSGLRPQDLKEPRRRKDVVAEGDEPKSQPARKRTYKRRDMRAEDT